MWKHTQKEKETAEWAAQYKEREKERKKESANEMRLELRVLLFLHVLVKIKQSSIAIMFVH